MATNVNVKNEPKKVFFSDLDYGDYFFADGALWIYLETFTFPNDDKIEECNAFCLDDTTVDYFPGDKMVTLVTNVNITFSL